MKIEELKQGLVVQHANDEDSIYIVKEFNILSKQHNNTWELSVLYKNYKTDELRTRLIDDFCDNFKIKYAEEVPINTDSSYFVKDKLYCFKSSNKNMIYAVMNDIGDIIYVSEIEI